MSRFHHPSTATTRRGVAQLVGVDHEYVVRDVSTRGRLDALVARRDGDHLTADRLLGATRG